MHIEPFAVLTDHDQNIQLSLAQTHQGDHSVLLRLTHRSAAGVTEIQAVLSVPNVVFLQKNFADVLGQIAQQNSSACASFRPSTQPARGNV